jgi:hypothetical protein
MSELVIYVRIKIWCLGSGIRDLEFVTALARMMWCVNTICQVGFDMLLEVEMRLIPSRIK